MCEFSCLGNFEESDSNQNAVEFENQNQFYERGVSDDSEINHAYFFDQNFDQFSDWTYAESDRCLFSCEDKNRKISHLSSYFRNKQLESFACAKTVFFNFDFD